MRFVFLVLAVIGTVLPMSYFLPWLSANDWDLGAMVEAWNVNDAATGLVYDLTVSFAALVIWVIWETMQNGRWLNLIAIPASLCIGVSCGLPLYLYLRSRPA